MKLPNGVNIIYEAYPSDYFWLYVPYNRDFIEALNINMIDRIWSTERKAYKIKSEFFYDVLQLTKDFFSKPDSPIFGLLSFEEHEEKMEII